MSFLAQSTLGVDLLTAIVRNPLTVSGNTSVMAAIAAMSGLRGNCTLEVGQPIDQHLEARSSCVVVTQQGRVQGIFTERDVVKLSAQGLPLEGLTVAQVMSAAVVTLRETEISDIFSILNLLQRHHIRHLPVVDEGDRLVGVLTQETLRQLTRPIDLLRLRTVQEVMTREVLCTPPSTSMAEIAQLMVARQVGSVLITTPGGAPGASFQRPLGLLTERDLVQFRALGLSLGETLAGQVMSSPVFTIGPEDSLWQVQEMMESRRIRRVVVTGDRGELLGIVTQSSVLQAFNPLVLYHLAADLEAKVQTLRAEKLALLENRTQLLEQQVAERTAQLEGKTRQEALWLELANQTHQGAALPEMLQGAVTQLRQQLQCDRVLLYQIQWADQDVPQSLQGSADVVCLKGAIVAEALVGPGRSRLHQPVQDPCVTAAWLEPYRQGRIRAISDIYQEDWQPCHQSLLADLDIRAKVMVPIVVGQRLWGLLIASYRHQPHDWQEEEVSLLRTVTIQLAIAIRQSQTYQQLQQELEERRAVEVELRRTEQRLRKAQQIAHLGTWELDHRTGILYWSEELFALLEQDPSQFGASYTAFAEKIYPADRDRVERVYQEHLGDRRPRTLTYRLQLSNQTVKQIRSQWETEFSSDGQPLITLGTVLDITELKQAEAALAQLNQTLEQRVQERTQALQERETRYRALLEGAQDMVLLTDEQGNILEANHQAEQLLGYSRQEFQGLTLDNLHPPEHQPKIVTSVQMNRKKEQYPLRDILFQCKDGQIIPTDGSVSVIKVNGERIILGIFGDIRDRYEAESALRASELRFRRVFDSNVVGMMFVTINGDILDANDRLLTMLGYERHDLENGLINWQALTPPEYAPADLLAISHLRRYGSIDPWEKCYYHRDGYPVPVLIGVATLSPEEETYVCVVVDIRDRKRYETALQNSQELLQTVLNTVPIAVFWKDRQSKILGCNQQFSAFTGIQNPDQAIGKSDLELGYPLENVEHYLQQDRQVIETEVSLFHIEEQVILEDGIVRWVETSKLPLRNWIGEVIGVVGTFQEITDRKQAQEIITQQNQQLALSNEELRRATRLKDEFLANMSHELRTPLNAILGMAEGLLEEIFGPINPEQRHALETLDRSGGHLLDLINDILDMATVEAGKLKLYHQPTTIAPLCQSSIALVYHQARKKDLAITAEIPKNLPDALLDERRIRQILLNLLNNAVKFTPSGGQVTLTVTVEAAEPASPTHGNDPDGNPGEPPPPWLCFTVQDTGIGIAPEHIQLLFQPFVQIDGTLNRQYEGTGLGLALVKRLVERHGGTVTLTSTEGVGSTFGVRLPYRTVQGSPPIPTLSSPTSPSLETLASHPDTPSSRIVLLDRPDTTLQTVLTYLQAKGYWIQAVAAAGEDWAAVADLQPSLLMVAMPAAGETIAGRALLQSLRQVAALREVPILAIAPTPADGEAYGTLAGTTVLSKPIKFKQLIQQVQTLLGTVAQSRP